MTRMCSVMTPDTPLHGGRGRLGLCNGVVELYTCICTCSRIMIFCSIKLLSTKFLVTVCEAAGLVPSLSTPVFTSRAHMKIALRSRVCVCVCVCVRPQLSCALNYVIPLLCHYSHERSGSCWKFAGSIGQGT